MKTQFLLIFSLAFIVSLSASAGNGNNDPKPQEPKKTVKPKYDFNIFKFFSIPTIQVDSLKPLSTPTSKKSLFFTDKNLYSAKRKSLTI